MEKCPVCGAKYSQKEICHRCKADLKLLLDIEKEASLFKKMALKESAGKKYEKMFRHASRSAALKSDYEALKLLACAALLSGRFDEALMYRAKAKSAAPSP